MTKRGSTETKNSKSKKLKDESCISELLHQIKEALLKMPEKKNFSIDDTLKWSKGSGILIPYVSLPKLGSPERSNVKMHIYPPKNIAVVGSFLLDTMINPSNLDLAVELPIETWDTKDEINYKFCWKRAFYLAAIAECIRDIPELSNAQLEWGTLRGHVLRPILIVKPFGKQNAIHIHVTLPSNVVKYHRFGPGKNLVRKNVVLDAEVHSGSLKNVNAGSLEDSPTPIYNSLLVLDLLMVPSMRMTHAECKIRTALRDCIKLGKAWIQQQKYNEYAFHLSGFQFSMICLYLAKIGRFENSMNDLQMFKTVMKFLSETDWCEPLYFVDPSTFSWIPESCQDDFLINSYKSRYSACLIEPIAGLNILFDWTTDVISDVQRDARMTLSLLSSNNPDLSSLFVKSNHLMTKYDALYQISSFNWKPDFVANFKHFADQVNPEVAKLKLISRKVTFGLSKRATKVIIHAKAPITISISNAKMRYDECLHNYEICLLLDRQESISHTQIGPLADSTDEVRAFRAFWRERAELHRFQDGSLREAVTWPRSTNSHFIVQDIINFTMKTHYQCDQIKCYDSCLEFAEFSKYDNSEPTQALRQLVKYLKDISDLPLSIISYDAISPQSRNTGIFPSIKLDGKPSPNALPPYVEVAEILVYFEGSSRWPEEYYGLIYAKQAFSVQICRRLMDSYGLSCSITEHYFDVMVNGYVFRCRIHHGEESRLTRLQGLDDSMVRLYFEEMPRHSRKIMNLEQNNSIFAPVCRLVRRWITSQMFLLRAELVELLVAKVFLTEFAPSSILSGFIRVLNLLKDHNWLEQPLLVDFDPQDEKKWSENSCLAEYHNSDPLQRPKIYIGCSYQDDSGCCIWSKISNVSRDDVLHLQQLSLAAISALDTDTEDYSIIFRVSPSRFDLVLPIRMAYCNTRFYNPNYDSNDLFKLPKSISSLIKRQASHDQLLKTLPGFNPVQRLIKELQEKIPDISIYYNELGGDIIGVNLNGKDGPTISKLVREIAGEMIEDSMDK